MKVLLLAISFLLFSYFGFWGAVREKKRILYLGELERLLVYMQSRISSCRQELDDIYMSFESPVLDRSGFSRILGSEGFCRAIRHIGIDGEERRVLDQLGSTLGQLCAEDQLDAIKRCVGELGAMLNKKRTEYPAKRRLYISLGIMLGAMIFILGI